MKKIKATMITLSIILLPTAALSMPWSWDMFTQPSHKAQEEKPFPPPDGAVPVTGKSVNIKDRGDAERLKNPVPPTAESVARGQERFGIYCLTCHGAGGKGDGPVGVKYVPPTDLSGEYVQTKPDGDIFYTITYGGVAIMPSYGDAMSVEDRWHIVNYIKQGLRERK